MQVPGAVEAEDDVPGLADMAGPEQAGSQEPREPAGAARELRAPVLELDLPAGGDPPGDGDRDRFAAARAGKATMDDMKGSTFTITNPGPFASYASAPIINQPNVGILCTDGVKRRPVAVGDAIAVHPTGVVGLVYDHRAFDGSTASMFLMHIRDSLEKRDWTAEVG